jgi:non-ribosomal peptide synthase protein (TIGR01720 family)
LLLTALARVLCRFSGDSSVLVELEGHGREELFPGVDLSRTVGWFTSAFPVRLTPAAGGGADALGESIKRVKEQLRALPDKGIGFGVLRYLASPETQRQLAALPQSRVTFNYLGQFDRSLGDGDSAFEPAAEGAGRSQSLAAPLDNWLSINGQVYRGELSLTCTYSREMYDAQTLEHLMRDYETELRQLIAHCAGRGVVGMTPSDIVGGSAEQADIDAVLADLGLEDFGDVT